MPKSGHNRKRYAAQARKKAVRAQSVTAQSNMGSAVSGETLTAQRPPAPVENPVRFKPAQAARPALLLTNIKPELRRIAILAGIMIVILVVLSRVLV